MTPPRIPLVRVAGSHAEVGAQVGASTAEVILDAVAHLGAYDPDLVSRYRAVTQEHVPWLVEELDGAAAAAGVEPLDLFRASIEELRESAVAPARCTDVVVTDGSRLVVAHTNDEDAGDEEDVVAIEWRVPGEPIVLTLGVGPWISVGWNDAGLSVTGNELAPNDEQVGIPRLLQVRDCLTRRTLTDAIGAILHPARASSYNWVLAHRDEGALNLEGSATAHEITRPGPDGTLAHANHYVCGSMRRYEREIDARRSKARHARAAELVAGKPADLRELLTDHEAPICNHGDPRGVKTVFWCVADVAAGQITYGRGNPCDSEAQVYRFASP